MINIKTCLSRNIVFRKFHLFNSHLYHCSSIFCYNFRPYHRDISEKVEDRFRSEDSISKDYRIIYRAPYVKYIKLSYAFTSISTSIVVPLVGFSLMTAGIGEYPVMMGEIPIINNSFELTTFFGVVFLVIGQLSYVVFKYPFRMYHNDSDGKYIAVFQHLLPGKKHKEEFNAGEVKKVVKGFSLWKECLYEINRKKTILLVDHFYLPQDFNNMLSSKEENK